MAKKSLKLRKCQRKSLNLKTVSGNTGRIKKNKEKLLETRKSIKLRKFKGELLKFRKYTEKNFG